jgi:hypothetical protein
MMLSHVHLVSSCSPRTVVPCHSQQVAINQSQAWGQRIYNTRDICCMYCWYLGRWQSTLYCAEWQIVHSSGRGCILILGPCWAIWLFFCHGEREKRVDTHWTPLVHYSV